SAFSGLFFFFQAEDGIRDLTVTGVQTCALPISLTPFDDLNLGWAHAGKTPGQPVEGVNDKFGNPAPAGSSNNEANLFSIGLKHRSEEHTSELQSQSNLVCRLLLEKKKKQKKQNI